MAVMLLYVSSMSSYCRSVSSQASLSSHKKSAPSILFSAPPAMDAVYTLLSTTDLPPICFSFLCNTLAVLTEEGILIGSSLKRALKSVHHWLGRFLHKVLPSRECDLEIPMSPHTITDSKKISAAYSSVCMKLLSSTNSDACSAAAESISQFSQELLDKYISPLEVSIPPMHSSTETVGYCVNITVSALLTALCHCIRVVTDLNISVEALMKCKVSPCAEGFIHEIIILVLLHNSDRKNCFKSCLSSGTSSPINDVIARLLEWAHISCREIGLAERAIKNCLSKYTSAYIGTVYSTYSYEFLSLYIHSIGS